MAGILYRTYEVLVEETLSANDPKRQKTSKPSRENANTRRALETTHRLFQDAVCYYILCLIGLVRDAKEAGAKSSNSDINPLWRTLTTGEMGKKTDQLVRRFMGSYPSPPWGDKAGLHDFIKGVYGAALADDTGLLIQVYLQLRANAVKPVKGSRASAGEGNELGDMARFANDWMQRLSNENSKQAGSAAKAVNNAYWVTIREQLQKAGDGFDDRALSSSIELTKCFDSPASELSGKDALLDYRHVPPAR